MSPPSSLAKSIGNQQSKRVSEWYEQKKKLKQNVVIMAVVADTLYGFLQSQYPICSVWPRRILKNHKRTFAKHNFDFCFFFSAFHSHHGMRCDDIEFLQIIAGHSTYIYMNIMSMFLCMLMLSWTANADICRDKHIHMCLLLLLYRICRRMCCPQSTVERKYCIKYVFLV